LWLAWGAQQAPAARQEAVQAIISRDRTNTVVIGQCKGQAIVAGSDARLRKPLQDDVPYTTQAMSQDLLRVQNAWDECQSHRERDAIYSYLTAVFDLVAWWAADNCALARAQKALRLQNIWPSDHDEPFAAIIRCTSDPSKVDKRTRSKWSRLLRYAAEYQPSSEPLAAFIRRKGGINECAARFTRCLRRHGSN
jgi:hypothetical protein